MGWENYKMFDFNIEGYSLGEASESARAGSDSFLLRKFLKKIQGVQYLGLGKSWANYTTYLN